MAMPGRRPRATIYDVAAQAGVSRMTVSRVLNAPHKVAAEKRRRVEVAIALCGFRPDPAARQLKLRGAGAAAASDRRVALAYADELLPRLGAVLTSCLA